MGATVIVDAFWGDAGKGKFSAWLCRRNNASICVRAGIGPNAGHSTWHDGKLVKARLLPLGVMNHRTRVMIGAGVAIDPQILLEEIKRFDCSSRVLVDWRCPVIEACHKEREELDRVLCLIDSTKSGAGAARADYVMRRAKRAQEVASLAWTTGDVALECNRAAEQGSIVIEGAQATYLSLYLSDRYPYVTSDNCTTPALLDDVGLDWRLLTTVLLLVKCLPTAVGEGPLPMEMTAAEIRDQGLEEFGTNTGRSRRRVRRIPRELLTYAVMLNGATEIALTFCDQYDHTMKGARAKGDVTDAIRELIESIEDLTNVPVRYLSTGRDLEDVVEL